MNKICTSIKQSEKLIELGIDVNTVDMFYADLLINGKHKYNPHLLESYEFKTFEETKVHTTDHLGFIPAWSLTALIKMLPEGFLLMDNQGVTEPILYSVWVPGYYKPSIFWKNNLVDAVFEIIVWLKENNGL